MMAHIMPVIPIYTLAMSYVPYMTLASTTYLIDDIQVSSFANVRLHRMHVIRMDRLNQTGIVGFLVEIAIEIVLLGLAVREILLQ